VLSIGEKRQSRRFVASQLRLFVEFGSGTGIGMEDGHRPQVRHGHAPGHVEIRRNGGAHRGTRPRISRNRTREMRAPGNAIDISRAFHEIARRIAAEAGVTPRSACRSTMAVPSSTGGERSASALCPLVSQRQRIRRRQSVTRRIADWREVSFCRWRATSGQLALTNLLYCLRGRLQVRESDARLCGGCWTAFTAQIPSDSPSRGQHELSGDDAGHDPKRTMSLQPSR
jgi:hypothetical protein